MNKVALGVEFSDYFDPIPLSTLALIFSVVCVSEYFISSWSLLLVGRLNSVLVNGPQANLPKLSSMTMQVTPAMIHISLISRSGTREIPWSLARSVASSSSVQCECLSLSFVPIAGSLADDICRRGAGAKPLVTTSRITEEARVRAQQELEGRTGDTDSEEDG